MGAEESKPSNFEDSDFNRNEPITFGIVKKDVGKTAFKRPTTHRSAFENEPGKTPFKR